MPPYHLIHVRHNIRIQKTRFQVESQGSYDIYLFEHGFALSSSSDMVDRKENERENERERERKRERKRKRERMREGEGGRERERGRGRERE